MVVRGGRTPVTAGVSTCRACRGARECAEPACTRTGRLQRGFCKLHYKHAKARGDFGGPSCSNEGCGRTAIVRGFCQVHYNGWRRRNGYADPNSGEAGSRIRHYGVPYEPIDRLAVFERDSWRCGLCGGVVDRELVWPDPRCATVDHVVALSVPGSPGHVWGNVQCAHNDCNTTKGAGGL